MEDILALASQYGTLGLTLLATFWYINKRDQDRKEEREKMNERFEKQHERALIVTEQNTRVISELIANIKKN